METMEGGERPSFLEQAERDGATLFCPPSLYPLQVYLRQAVLYCIQGMPLLIFLSRITFNCFLHNFYYTIYLLNLERKQTVRQAGYPKKKY